MAEGKARLEGKVAIVTGAGSSGPGYGTGKATSVLFAREGARVLLVDRDAGRAEETSAHHRRGGRRGVGVRGRRVQLRRLPCDGRGRGRAVRQAGRADEQRRRNQDRHRRRCGRGRLGHGDGREPEGYDARVQARHPRDDRDGRRLHREHLVRRGGAARLLRRPHALLRLEGRRGHPHLRHGRAARARQHPRQLHPAGLHLHADGRAAPVGGGAEPAGDGRAPRHGGYGVGHSPRGPVPGQRRRPLGHGRTAARRRRPARGLARTAVDVPYGGPDTGGASLATSPTSGPPPARAARRT